MHLLEYILLRILEVLVQLLPRRVALAVGGMLGALMYRARFLRRTVDRNMDHVALWHGAEREAVVRRLYRTMGRYMIDFLWCRPGKVPHDFTNLHIVTRNLKGNGLLAVLGHFGNWEVLGTVFGSLVPSLHVVAMPMQNPHVEAWLRRKRAATGAVEIDKSKAVRKIVTALRGNNPVAVLIDQYAGKQGVMAPFLGRTANTVRTVAGLYHKTRCELLLSYALLQEDGSYHIHVEEGRNLDVPREDTETFINAYLREHNEVLSSWIRQHPDHWFGWFHRRFRGAIDYRAPLPRQ
jgi:Kdo2-lipid IVA lauroyltransferase/acyltransferase